MTIWAGPILTQAGGFYEGIKYIIKPAAHECGYKATRADEISEPGMITSQVIQRIVDDSLIIADLTDHNPNVFYELAIRHALRLPLVQIIRKGDKIPFDVAGMRTIPVDHRDLDSVAEAKNDIVKQIRSLENDPSSIETPISVSLDLQQLRQSENPQQRTLADVLSGLGDIRSALSKQDAALERIREQTNMAYHILSPSTSNPFNYSWLQDSDQTNKVNWDDHVLNRAKLILKKQGIDIDDDDKQ